MKKQRIIIFCMALCAAISAVAQKNVLILTDAAHALSGDTTVVSANAPGAKMSVDGLFVSGNVNVATGAFANPAEGQTIVPALHAQLSASEGEDITYWAVKFDKPASQWSKEDLPALPAMPDYVVVAAGTEEVLKCQGACPLKMSLSDVLGQYHGARFAFIQPNCAGMRYAARGAEEEFSAPRHETEQALYELALGLDAVVVPDYVGEFCKDGVTPRAASMSLIGDLVGKALVAKPSKPSIESIEPFKVVLSGIGFKTSTDYAAQAPNHGFEIWRNNGSSRMLNITGVFVSDGKVEITTNERLTGGDVLVYGTTACGVGRREGVRGNLTANNVPLPVFCAGIGTVVGQGDNVSGTITCEGIGVPGVSVSDGYVFAVTDETGKYSLESNKRNGYIFYILPSGYEPETEGNGWQVRVHAKLSSDVTEKEVHDFALRKVDNRRHTMIVGADAHIAARNSDKSQFKAGFIASAKKYAQSITDRKVYSTILGDMAWDQYWYANNYALPDFVASLTSYGWNIPFFAVMGNHDNDGATPADSETDFKAAHAFREVMAPTYYSYNLGDVHYVVLDDIVYKNTYTAGKSYSTGIVGDRDYGRWYTSEQLEWLRQDLAMIQDKTTPIIICFHAQNWALSTDGNFTVKANLDNGASEKLAEAVADFTDVHLLSGHTHYNFHAHPAKYPNVHENNIAGICATWWWTGKLVGRHICKDGSPGGYAVYTVDGKKISWKYHSSEDDTYPQMRVYDMNAVKKQYLENEDIKKWIASDATQTNYGNIADNTVYINVFNYDTDWKIEVTEDDKPLTVKRICAQDPLHVICYEVPRYKAASTVTADFVTNKTNHMFMVKTSTADAPVMVKVTDSFGNVYTKTLERPGVFNTDI